MSKTPTVRPLHIHKLREKFDFWHSRFMNYIFYKNKEVYVVVNMMLLYIEVQITWQSAYTEEWKDVHLKLTADSTFLDQIMTLVFFYEKVLREAATYKDSLFQDMKEIVT